MITAIFENGVFRPTEKVDLPEGVTVRFEPEEIETPTLNPTVPSPSAGQLKIYDVLSRRFNSGSHDLAERHNEHQP